MKKYFNKKNTLALAVSFIAFFITTLLTNRYLSVFDVSSVRLSAALNPVLGIAFGWPAILGCALANFLCDLISGWGIVTALLGFPAQILYGFIPCFLWRRYIRSESHLTRLDRPKKVSIYLAILLLDTVFIGLAVGLIQYAVTSTDLWSTAFFAFINDFTASVFLGLPLLTLLDLYYSHVLHKGKRKLSYNEKILLIYGLTEIVSFALLTVWGYLRYPEASTVEKWSKIFLLTLFVSLFWTFAAFLWMGVAAHIREKNAGLRIVEKKTGTIFADEKKHLEFVSFPGLLPEKRIKADCLGYSLENAKSTVPPTYEAAWYTQFSTQKGCPMKCLFCDCPSYGFYGNVTREDFRYQLSTVLQHTGSTHTGLFHAAFDRMGEPSFNEDLLPFLEFDLKDRINEKVKADAIVPFVSTMCPKNAPQLKEFLQSYARIKNEVYGGQAELQISISTTDETERNRIYKNLSLSLKEISDTVRDLPVPKGSKYYLNFPLSEDTVVDADILERYFDKNKFAVTFTPMHHTFNAQDNGYGSEKVYDSYETFEKAESRLLSLGWDVLVYMDRKSEDEDELTSGNLLISHIRDKKDAQIRRKRVVGMVVAIETEALFRIYPQARTLENPSGFPLYYVEKDHYVMYVVRSGMGECAAAAACQFLISRYNVSMIINFGVTGGLTPDMKKLKVCLVDKVVHYKYDCSEFMPLVVGQVDGYDSIFIKTTENMVKNVRMLDPDITLATICSGDKFIGTEKEKIYLHETFHGDLCDMESAGIVLTCHANKVPCVLFKAVSDGLADGAEGFYKELLNASLKCLDIADKTLDLIADIES